MIGITPHMTRNEVELLKAQWVGKQSYLEYGCGGSTKLAVKSPLTRVVSVESDGTWIEKLREDPTISAAETSGKLRFIYANIGEVGEWGAPRDDREFRRWPAYYTDIWTRGDSLFDVVLIDGRFRTACALACAVFADTNTTVLIHDYSYRPAYYVAEKYFDTIAQAESLTVFRRRPAINMRAWAFDMLSHALTPD